MADEKDLTNLTEHKHIEQFDSTLAKVKLILKILKGGSTIESACKEVDLSKPTFYTWANNSLENKQKLYDIIDNRTLCVEDALFRKALEGDVKAVTFFLKNRGSKRWSDRHNIELSGNKENPIELNITSEPTEDLINSVIAKLTEKIG